MFNREPRMLTQDIQQLFLFPTLHRVVDDHSDRLFFWCGGMDSNELEQNGY
ncbi:hypothetical protein PPNSA23_42140 [Phyllobacterium phragmitis]|uniref:Uncharacterized protein n=1 Tax=Phyllobacterium phragmitis TaxID=2670329 RepID=A0ABQ0H5S0_9HYPH